MQNVINIDGKEYPTEAFDDTQKYVVTQIRNLQVYTNQLIASVKKEENSNE